MWRYSVLSEEWVELSVGSLQKYAPTNFDFGFVVELFSGEKLLAVILVLRRVLLWKLTLNPFSNQTTWNTKISEWPELLNGNLCSLKIKFWFCGSWTALRIRNDGWNAISVRMCGPAEFLFPILFVVLPPGISGVEFSASFGAGLYAPTEVSFRSLCK